MTRRSLCIAGNKTRREDCRKRQIGSVVMILAEHGKKIAQNYEKIAEKGTKEDIIQIKTVNLQHEVNSK